MDRQDIASEKPWAMYLLDEGADKIFGKRELSDDDRLNRGIAEMKMLDAKLKEVSKVSNARRFPV
jgi:hypothetical protein